MNTEPGYRVIDAGGCKLVKGPWPLTLLSLLLKDLPQHAVMDPHVARVTGSSLAVGCPQQLQALLDDPLIQQQALERVEALAPNLPAPAKRWLALGHQGESSQAMFQHLSGHDIGAGLAHPFDASDMARCRLLLEQVPELHARLDRMAAVSPAWASLAAAWDELCALMDLESPQWREFTGRAPRTTERMRALLRRDHAHAPNSQAAT